MTNLHGEANRGSKEDDNFQLVFIVELGARRAQIATAQGNALGKIQDKNVQPERLL